MSQAAPSGTVGRLLANARFEIVPTDGLEAELRHLAPGTTVTVTCSPRKGIDRTLEIAEHVQGRGFRAVPHLSARLVTGRSHLRAILRRASDAGFRELFVVGGDATEPAGPYASAGELLREMAELDHGVEAVGVAAYPERHPLIDEEELLRALLEKQPFAHHMVTQICFDPGALVRWLDEVRGRGVTLPVYVGVAGAVRRRRLLEISLRVGIGDSVRYLTKHGGIVARLLRGGSYRPDGFLAGLAPLVAGREDVLGLHLNTFNQVEATERWRREALRAYGYAPAAEAFPEEDAAS